MIESNPQPVELHTYLRAWRRSKHLTLEQVADLIGSKNNTISGWETGARGVGLDDIKRLAAAYGCHPAALLFPPEKEEEYASMREAADILAAMTPAAAAEWLAIGRRIAGPEKPSQPAAAKAETATDRPATRARRKDRAIGRKSIRVTRETA